MRFKLWVENEFGGESALAPPSAEVVKTGLQPQVDAKEIKTRQKEEHDKMMAIDGHMQRIASILPSVESGSYESDKLKKIADFLKEMSASWDRLKSDNGPQDSSMPDPWNYDPRQADWMRENQPLPEPSRSSDHPTAF